MSQFITRIPVDVQSIIASLPKNHFLHSVSFDKNTNEVIVLWEADQFWSGLTIPVDLPPADVIKKRLPKGVRKGKPSQPSPEVKAAPSPVSAPIQPIPDENAIIGREAFDKAIADKVPMEYQGMTAEWKPVVDGHGWTAGYYYRKAKAVDVNVKV
ncbi:MAG: hypothetical protein KGL39_52530 [Patescibacteria group bacterium]|nr:hypothetical protein [Patescibacteria group bacterium]